MTRQHPHKRRGVTLVELLLTISITVVLFGGIASAVLLSSHALPKDDDAFVAITNGATISEQISSELFSAITVTERTPTAITFTTADRNQDNNPETIRYAWSGVPGDPLTRKYNSFPAKTVKTAVYDFNLNYNVDISSQVITHEATVYGTNQLLASFESWPATAADIFEQVINSTSWTGQYFETVTPPEATSLLITSVKVRMISYVIPSPAMTIGIHRSTLDGSFAPAATAIGSEIIIPNDVMDTIPTWTEAFFTDVIINDPQRTDYCLVLKGLSTSSVFAQYLFHRQAPENGTAMKWTTDSGTTWGPVDRDIDQQDLEFFVYGAFGTISTVTDSVDRYFLKSIELSLQLTNDPTTNVMTNVQILNTPEVTP